MRGQVRSRAARPCGRDRRKARADAENKPEPPVDEFTPKTRVFFTAVRNGDVETVRQLLETKDVHVNARDVEDNAHPTALLAACEHRQHDVIDALLTAVPRHADVNLENTKGKRPIWWAAKFGDEQMANLLLETENQKCEVNYLDKESGCTPLYRSILTNSTEVCAALIHAGADVNLRRLGISGDNAAAESPLIKAVQLNNVDIVDMLVNSLCDMDARTEDGLTALHYAVGYRRYAIARKLLVNKIPIGAKSSRGVTAMTVAIEQRNPAMVRLLLRHGYNPDARFDWGETPLEMAIGNHSEDCALALVHEGCSLNVPSTEETKKVGRLGDSGGKPSYFLQAISEGLLNLVRLLIEVRPSYLSEPWLRFRYIPLALYKRARFYEALHERACCPRPLLAMCRAVIFKSLGRKALTKVDALPLPKKLRNYVSFKDEFPKDVFDEVTLFTDDCPYDCSFSCDKPQCPVLDFSSSSEDELDPDS